MRAPVRPDLSALGTAFGAGQAPTKRSDRHVIREVVGIERGAVVADDIAAIDEQVTAAMASNMA